jgi:hypothetical protein
VVDSGLPYLKLFISRKNIQERNESAIKAELELVASPKLPLADIPGNSKMNGQLKRNC